MGATYGRSERHNNRLQDPLPAHGSPLAPDSSYNRGQPANVRAGEAREECELPGQDMRVQRQRHRPLLRVARHRDLRERPAGVRGAQRSHQHEKYDRYIKLEREF